MQHKLKKQQSAYNCTFNNVVSCLAVAYKLNWSEYFSVSSNEVARQPIVFVWIPIIIINLPWESMAAHRTPWCKVVKFGTLVQDPPISPWSKFEVASPTALAPPTGQSSTCIHVYNFQPIHPIFTNQISLDFLGQAEFNAPYVVVSCHDGFSAILVWNATPFTNLMEYCSNSKPFARYSQSNSTAKPPNRKKADISTALWHIITILGT